MSMPPTIKTRILSELKSSPQGLTPSEIAARMGAVNFYSVASVCSKLFAYGQITRVITPRTQFHGSVARALYFAKA